MHQHYQPYIMRVKTRERTNFSVTKKLIHCLIPLEFKQSIKKVQSTLKFLKADRTRMRNLKIG